MDPLLDYSLARTMAPVSLPVTLTEAKKQANVVAEDDDAQITRLIEAATDQVERDSNRALMTQTWRMRRHDWPTRRYLVLPRAPLQSVTAVTYRNLSGQTATWSSAEYLVDTDREPGVLWLHPLYDWPSDADTSMPQGITLTFVAGHASQVPPRAKQAILLLVGHWYRNREAVGTVAEEIALAYTSLIRGLKPAAYP